MKKRLLPIALLAVVGMLATGCQNNPAPSSSLSEGPASSSQSQYSVSITNADELTQPWYLDDADRSISLSCAPGVVKDVLGTELLVTSSDTSVVTIINNKMAHPVGVGEADIIATYHDVESKVHVTIGAERPIQTTPIKDVIDAAVAGGSSETAQFEIKGTVTAIMDRTFVIQDGDYGMYIYNNAYEGIELGQLAYVKSTFTMYYGLPETKTVDNKRMLEEEGPEITPLLVTKDTEKTAYLASRLCTAEGMKITVKGDDAVASTTYRYDKTDNGFGFYVSKYLAADTLAEINAKLNRAFEEGMLIDIDDSPMYVATDGYYFTVYDADQITLKETAPILPTAISLSAEKTTIAVGSKLTITPTFTPADCNRKGLNWTSSDETVATVEGGVVTPLKAGTVTITATSNVEGCEGVKGTIDLTVIAPNFDTTIVAGGSYFLGYEKGADTFYSDGTFSETKDLDKAGLITVEAGTGDFDGAFALKNADGKYLGATVTSKDPHVATTHYLNGALFDTPFYWDWDEDHFCFTVELSCGETGCEFTTTGYIGRYYKGGKLAVNDIKYLGQVDNEECHLFRQKEEGFKTSVAVGDKVIMALYHGNLVNFLYLNGELSGTYAATSKKLSEALAFEVEAGSTEGTFKLKSSKGYFGGEKPEGKTFFVPKFDAATGVDAKFNTEINAFTFALEEGNESFLGTSNTGTYATFGFTKLEKAASNFIARAYSYVEPGPTLPTHAGTEADPYDVPDACYVAKKEASSGPMTEERFFKGVITNLTSSTNGYTINCTLGDETFNVTSAKLAAGVEEPSVGDTIVAKGRIDGSSSGYYKMGYIKAEEYGPTVISVTHGNSPVSVEGEHCTVTLSDGSALPESVVNGSELAFKVAPAENYVIVSVKVYGNAVTPTDSIYKVKVAGPVKIVVETASSSDPIPVTTAITFDGSVTPDPKSNDECKFVFGVATFDLKKGTSSTSAGGDKQGYVGSESAQEIRLYKGQELSISATKKITKVELTISNNSSGNYEGCTFTNCTSALVGTGTASLSNLYTATLTPTDGALALGITVSKGAFRIHSITVYYLNA